MPESEKKKRRSGRARDENDESGSPPAAPTGDANEKLQKPWLPLFWLLIPLMASVAYGLATRGH